MKRVFIAPGLDLTYSGGSNLWHYRSKVTIVNDESLTLSPAVIDLAITLAPTDTVESFRKKLIDKAIEDCLAAYGITITIEDIVIM